MVKALISSARRFYIYLKIFLYLFLTDIFVQFFRTQGKLNIGILDRKLRLDNARSLVIGYM